MPDLTVAWELPRLEQQVMLSHLIEQPHTRSMMLREEPPLLE
jgi:hypothetical protein